MVLLESSASCSNFFLMMSKADGMSSVCKCVDDTVLGSYVVVTVPWEVQVSMSGFSVHPYCESSICFSSDDSIQKRYGAIFFCLLYSKLDRRIYCIDVLEELFLMYLMLQHKGIIYIPFPYPGGCSAVVIALCSKASMNMLAMIGLMGDPMAAPLVCS